MSLPELTAPADLYYNEDTAERYTTNSRVTQVQREMSKRCILHLEPKKDDFVLDVGCGSGLSGSVLTESKLTWIGVDLSLDMLKLAKEEGKALDYLRVDIGEGLPFQPGTFDGVISVSVIQWLFYTYSSDHVPIKRIRTFFTQLYSVCKPSARCVLQFYLKQQKHIDMLKNEALRAGFHGGIHIENANSKNSKSFLILHFKPMEKKKHKPKKKPGRIDFIKSLKERRRRKGFDVPADTKYTGKKRSKR